MATKAAKTAKKAPAKRASTSASFTAEERAAIRERAKEAKGTGLDDLLAKIAAMPDDDRQLAEGVHALVSKVAPELTPRTWYGMPAYAKDGKVLCFFQNAAKFKVRYSTFGFSDVAQLDDGGLWPTTYAIAKLTPKVRTELTALLKRAIG